MPTVAQLKAQLKALGLPLNGNKADLEQRLDQAKAPAADPKPSPQKRALKDGAGDSKKTKMVAPVVPTDSPANRLFDQLSGGEDVLDPEKTLAFCEQLKIDPEKPEAIALSYFLRSPKNGTFERVSFVEGAHAIGVSTLEGLASKLPQLAKQAAFNGAEFDNVYKFAFAWGCEPGIRNMQKEVAISLWQLLIPRSSFRYMDDWISFWEANPSRVVTKDEWLSFRRFVDIARTSKKIVEADDAWPTAIDEFIEVLKKKGVSA